MSYEEARQTMIELIDRYKTALDMQGIIDDNEVEKQAAAIGALKNVVREETDEELSELLTEKIDFAKSNLELAEMLRMDKQNIGYRKMSIYTQMLAHISAEFMLLKIEGGEF